MDIGFFVDSHGTIPKLLHQSVLPDIIVCAGDFTIFFDDFLEILFYFNDIKKPFLIIPGNHEEGIDFDDELSYFDNLINIHKKTFLTSFNKKELLFFGLGEGGFSKKKPDARFFLEDDLVKNVEKKIFVTHAPPYKTKLDKLSNSYTGNITIRDVILKTKPIISVSGHIHENTRKKSFLGDTLIINPGKDGVIVTLDDKFEITKTKFL